jgi:NodT family efflux transporter outer membrane factor (OMF) lipoprotein
MTDAGDKLYREKAMCISRIKTTTLHKNLQLGGVLKPTLLPGCLTILFVLVLTGCMVGKSYQTPDVSRQMAKNWNAPETDAALDSRQQPVADWWRQFDDEVLTALMEKLSESSLALAEARERIMEAYARRGIVRADTRIQVAATADYTHAEAGDEAVSFTGPPAGTSADLFTTATAAVWEIDLWGRTEKLVDAADADIDARYADYRSMKVSLCAELALAYIDYRTLQARMSSVTENIDLQEKTLALARTRYRSGVGSALDVSRTKQLLQSTKARIPELSRAIRAAENRIDLLLGVRPGETPLPAGPLPEAPQLIGIGVPLDLMTRRPDITGAALRYRAAVSRTGAAEADKYPRLSLSGTLSLQSDTLGGMLDSDALIYSLGPDLYFPLFTGGRIESVIQQRTSQAEQARLALSRTILEALSEVETAAEGVIQSKNQVEALREAETSARESVEFADTLFQAGLGDFFQVLDSQKQMVSTQESLLLARQQALSDVVSLYRALGGGWEKSSEQ